MQSSENNITSYGGFFVRLAAFIMDMLIVQTILLITIRLPFAFQSSDSWFTRPILFEFGIYNIVLYLAVVAYFVAMTYVTGSTLGKKMFNLKVISSSDKPLTLFNVIYRETIGRYLSSLLFVGYFMIGASETKKGLHDILADTQVIYTCKLRPVTKRTSPISAASNNDISPTSTNWIFDNDDKPLNHRSDTLSTQFPLDTDIIKQDNADVSQADTDNKE